MAKHQKKWEGKKLTYTIPGVGDAVLDTSALSPEIIQKALEFAFPTLARNATAGLMADEDKPTALKRIQERFKNFMDGVWRSGGGAESAERPTSMLARALAQVRGCAPEEAAQLIADLIDANVEKQGLSPDEEEDKVKIRAVASAVRKTIAENAEIVPVLARIRADEAAKKAEAAAQVTVKEGAPKLSDILGR